MFLPFQTKLRLPSHVINFFWSLVQVKESVDAPDEAGSCGGMQMHLSSIPSSDPFLCENPSTLPQFLHIVPFSVSCFENRSAQMCQTRLGSLRSFVLKWHLLAAFVSFLFHAAGFCKRWNFRRRGQPHKFATVTSPTIVGVTTCHAQEVEKDPEAGLAGLLCQHSY